ncbi:sensor histidine kinase [Anaeromicrobium sediminis]|uniref:histidine kinase n=1 Tax=Anaeromicrobium sediminis TaxID=1478221 RepID=A0A267MNC1_9FIRM|nr:HAMP domain-containing sensor histidine kinase [Anaeromicrobium sediminis]PAB61094.1 two-component sensor histidine kinase [Anaeromicrobium sediminis]
MKFWQKIFLYFLILFLIIFNFTGFFLIENSHKIQLEREVDRGLSEHWSIYSGMSVNLALAQKQALNYYDYDKILYSATVEYLKNFNDENMHVEILDEGNNIIFSNIDFEIEGKREELIDPLEDKRRYIIRDISDKTFLFITNVLYADEKAFKFSYVRDITYIYEDKESQFHFFMKLNAFIFIVLIIGLYILSKNITKPISKMIGITKRIAKGNYSERVNIHTKDEIGVLSENFNEMSEAIEEKINELEKKTEEKQRFIDNLTHELKTPLTSIIGYADYLRSTEYNEEIYLKGLNYIFSEGKRLESLSWKMMNLILLKKEKFKMKNENIKNILLEIKDALKPKLQEKNVELVIIGEEYEVLVERDLIKNLIINLIDNAIKASKYGSKIYISLYKKEGLKNTLEIKDEGIGIPKEDLYKIFEPFYMVDKSRSRENNGVGLGLSICAEIGKIHGLELEVISEINKGTTIKIVFG